MIKTAGYQLDSYKNSDYLEVLKCAKNVRSEMGWFPINPEHTPDLYDIPGTFLTNKGNFWVLKEGSKVIGMCGLEDVGEGRGVLRRFYLDKAYQGRGLGQKIFGAVIDFSKGRGFKKLFLGTSPDAVAANIIYKKFGFEPTSGMPDGVEYFAEEYFELNLTGKK